MSNTLKFGAGEWATKEGSTLAYNYENGNYKPLPFNFERAGSATRVNKEGLIEVVSNNEPRIDFLNDSKGALKLEPSRSNLITYSEDFSDASWTKSNAAVTLSSELSPMGILNTYDVVYTSGGFLIESVSTTKTIGSSETISVFSKSDIVGKFLKFGGGTASGTDVEKKEDYGNGWFRYSVTRTFTEAETGSTQLIISSTDIGLNTTLFGAQLEQGSYPTSYIPTSGSAVTRVAESCNGAGNEQVINSTEGVLFAEISALEDSPTGYLSLSNSSSTQVRLGFLFGNLYTQIRIDNNVLYSYSENGILTQNNKLAIFWNNNTQKFFVNGFLVDTDALDTTISANTLNKLSFDVGTGGGPFHGKVKDVRVYNQALTDQELINLTKI